MVVYWEPIKDDFRAVKAVKHLVISFKKWYNIRVFNTYLLNHAQLTVSREKGNFKEQKSNKRLCISTAIMEPVNVKKNNAFYQETSIWVCVWERERERERERDAEKCKQASKKSRQSGGEQSRVESKKQ